MTETDTRYFILCFLFLIMVSVQINYSGVGSLDFSLVRFVMEIRCWSLRTEFFILCVGFIFLMQRGAHRTKKEHLAVEWRIWK